MAKAETRRLEQGAGAPAGEERPVKAAGARFAVAFLWLRQVRWQRFVQARFLGATLAATVLVQLVSFPAYAPIGAAAGKAADEAPYVGFSAALREAYRSSR